MKALLVLALLAVLAPPGPVGPVPVGDEPPPLPRSELLAAKLPLVSSTQFTRGGLMTPPSLSESPLPDYFALGCPRFVDFDFNGVVDIVDLMVISSRVGCKAGDACYEPCLDFLHDGVIDDLDWHIVYIYWNCRIGDACYW